MQDLGVQQPDTTKLREMIMEPLLRNVSSGFGEMASLISLNRSEEREGRQNFRYFEKSMTDAVRRCLRGENYQEMEFEQELKSFMGGLYF